MRLHILYLLFFFLDLSSAGACGVAGGVVVSAVVGFVGVVAGAWGVVGGVAGAVAVVGWKPHCLSASATIALISCCVMAVVDCC
jgi:hypothetical protein